MSHLNAAYSRRKLLLSLGFTGKSNVTPLSINLGRLHDNPLFRPQREYRQANVISVLKSSALMRSPLRRCLLVQSFNSRILTPV